MKHTKKKVLITNHHLVNYAGSELNVFDLARTLELFKYDVTVATFEYNYPIKEIFEDNQIKVINVLEADDECKIYDLIWSQHSPLLYYYIFEKKIRAQKIIFSSLSPFEPLEVPPAFVNDLTLCLANSQETKEQLLNEGVNENNIYILNNTVTNEFFDSYNDERVMKLNKICIISNHIPPEIYESIKIFKDKGVQVDIFGKKHWFELVTPEKIKEYDCIISIGRSIQYGLAIGIPVYCYDKFGGPGWIHLNNIEQAEFYNFSGRCTNKRKTPEEIVNEIFWNYESIFLQRFQLHFYALKYSLDENLKKIFKIIAKRNDVCIDKIFEEYYFLLRHNRYYVRLLRKIQTENSNSLNLSCDNYSKLLLVSFDYLIRSYIKENKEITIWGANIVAHNLLKNSPILSENVKYVIDSDSQKHGTMIENKIIRSPSCLIKNQVDVIIITSISYCDEIVNEIKNTYKINATIINYKEVITPNMDS